MSFSNVAIKLLSHLLDSLCFLEECSSFFSRSFTSLT
jgi:hypothetical protein